MIVSDQDAQSRLGSPLNLMNRLNNITSKRRDAMGLFGINKVSDDIHVRQPGDKPSVDINTDNKLKEDEDEEVKTTFNPFHKKRTTALVPLPNHPSNLPNYTPPTSSSAETSESAEPQVEDLIGNVDTQVKLGLAHDKALDTLVCAVDLMKMKLDDIKPDKLPGVISATSKVVDQIQRQRIDINKNKGNRDVHFHFYTPTQKKLEDYTVVEVG